VGDDLKTTLDAIHAALKQGKGPDVTKYFAALTVDKLAADLAEAVIGELDKDAAAAKSDKEKQAAVAMRDKLVADLPVNVWVNIEARALIVRVGNSDEMDKAVNAELQALGDPKRADAVIVAMKSLVDSQQQMTADEKKELKNRLDTVIRPKNPANTAPAQPLQAAPTSASTDATLDGAPNARQLETGYNSLLSLAKGYEEKTRAAFKVMFDLVNAKNGKDAAAFLNGMKDVGLAGEMADQLLGGIRKNASTAAGADGTDTEKQAKKAPFIELAKSFRTSLSPALQAKVNADYAQWASTNILTPDGKGGDKLELFLKSLDDKDWATGILAQMKELVNKEEKGDNKTNRLAALVKIDPTKW